MRKGVDPEEGGDGWIGGMERGIIAPALITSFNLSIKDCCHYHTRIKLGGEREDGRGIILFHSGENARKLLNVSKKLWFELSNVCGYMFD